MFRGTVKMNSKCGSLSSRLIRSNQFLVSLFILSLIPISAKATWNWEADDAFIELINNSSTTNDYSISEPWADSDHFGVKVTTQKPTYEKGWRLVRKRFVCPDKHGDSCVDPNRLTDDLPHFILYNVYTGVFRAFIYLTGDNINSGNALLAKYSFVDVHTNSSHDSTLEFGLFANDQSISVPINEITSVHNSNQEQVTTAFFRNWLVLDIPTSYDPNLNPSLRPHLALRIQLYSRSVTDFSARGELQFMLGGSYLSDQYLDDRTVLGSSKASNLIGAVTSAADKYNEVRGQGEEISNFLTSKSTSLRQSGNAYERRLGLEMANIATIAIGASTGAAIVQSGVSLVSAFSDNGSAGSSHIQFDSASLNFSGSLTTDSNLEPLTIGLPGSSITGNPANPSIDDTVIDDYDGPLGLFSLSERPRLT